MRDTSVDPQSSGLRSAARRKLAQARKGIHASGRDILKTDGEVLVNNVGEIALRARADTFVAGSVIFGGANYAATTKGMRAAVP